MAKTASAKNDSIRFKLHGETKGAVRYQEVDSDGNEAKEYRIGSLYFRKSQFAKISADYASTGKPAQFLTVTVIADDK